MTFGLENAPDTIDVECDTTASDKIWGEPEGLKSFICPKDCSKKKHKVFNQGTEYFFKSSVCQAAIHSGIMTEFGGAVQLIFTKPIKVYEGTSNAGINGQ